MEIPSRSRTSKGATPPDVDEVPTRVRRAAPLSDHSAPTHIGGYRVRGELGRGGMGIVYLAEDPKLRRDVALKLLPTHLASDPSAYHQFEREAQLLASLNHPNIAIIHSLEDGDSGRFLTMERVEGCSLEERIATDGALAVEATVNVGRQIACALEAAHTRGVVHRDLKPLNVMVTPDDRVKVLDFGLARVMSSEDLVENPSSGTLTPQEDPGGGDSFGKSLLVGTPGYMSPEQVRGEGADPRTDVFAFGCVLFECLSGRRVFEGHTPFERVQATLEAEPDLRCLPCDTPPELRDLIERCLPKVKDERLDSILDARRTLEAVLERRKLDRLLEATERVPEGEPRPHNLPAPLTRFVGRVDERRDVLQLLSDCRLVTLTGPGGCGKSRLATEIAKELLPDIDAGVWMVEMASIQDSSQVIQTVASVLALKETQGRPILDVLSDHLRAKTLLLILDNCEHVLDGSTELLLHLLPICPGLRVVSTSRQPLGMAGEWVYSVPPLEVPAPDSEQDLKRLRTVESAELFLDRAAAAGGGFELTAQTAGPVIEICRRLEGIPFALELAAARVRTHPVGEIVKRLDNRFRFLRGGVRGSGTSQHQTLRALLDWSHDQLTEAERALFRRLSVFAGGWTQEAAEGVITDGPVDAWDVGELTSRLVEKSLVELDTRVDAGTTRIRYRMLETVKQYARLLLETSDDRHRVTRRHVEHFVGLAETAESKLVGPDQIEWLSRLAMEAGNFRVALETSLEPGFDATIGLRLAGALGMFWEVRGIWSEGRTWCEHVLDRDGARDRSTDRARVLTVLSSLEHRLGNYEPSRRHQLEALEISREVKDRSGEARALTNLGTIHRLADHDYERSRECHEAALRIHERAGDRSGVAQSLNNLGNLMREQGNYHEAQQMLEAALEIHREHGHQRGRLMVLTNLGINARDRGDYVFARSCHEEGLELARELDDRDGMAWSLDRLASIAYATDLAEAFSFARQSLAIREDLGDRLGAASSLNALGFLSNETGNNEDARVYYQRSLEMYRSIGDQRNAICVIMNLGNVSRHEGEFAEAHERYLECLRMLRSTPYPVMSGLVHQNLGKLYFTEGSYPSAQEHYTRSLLANHERGDLLSVSTLLVDLGELAASRHDFPRSAVLLGASESILATVDAARPRHRSEGVDSVVDEVRKELDVDQFESSWACGKSMTPNEAVEFAKTACEM